MPLKQQAMSVYMPGETPDDEPIEHNVKLILADQIRAEREIRRRGLTTDYSITLGSAMGWSALVRLNLTELDFDQFTEVCLNVQKPEDDDDEADVDPTKRAESNDSA